MLSTVMNDAKKRVIKDIVGTVIFLLLLSLGAAGLYNVFKWKDTSGDYFSSMELMYDLPDNISDVACFGSSIVYCGINPAIFWEEDGIACYNAAISGQDREASYYYIREFVKKQSPKVVVVAGILFQTDSYGVQGNVYRNTLSMRNSRNFIDVVNSIVPDNDKTEKNTVWDYYLRWPIIHSRYKEIRKWDFVKAPENSETLGYVYSYDGTGIEPIPVMFNKDIVNEISSDNKDWVDRLYALSQKEGFELLFVQFPGFLGDAQRAEMNGNFKYLDELGIKHLDLNFYADEMGFDYVDDMSDGYHAKASGAKKISAFLSEYIADNFDVADRRGEKGYELFDEAVRVCKHEELSRRLVDCDDLAQVFELMNSEDGMMYSLTLKEGWSGISEETEYILMDYVKTDGVGVSGGTLVSGNGFVKEVIDGEPFTYKLNDSDYLYVKPMVSSKGHYDEVLYGSAKYVSAVGNFLVIYDTVLGRVVLVREIL